MSRSRKALYVLLAALAMLGGGYRWGQVATSNARDAQDARKAQQESDSREAEIKRGDIAIGALQLDLRDLATDYQQLDKAFNEYRKRNSILARRGAAPGPAAAGAQAQMACSDATGAEPGLSNGAVWMWNSALEGADRPSGTCGLSDQPEEACTADSGITLDEAWANQALNAKLCAEDRTRHQHLIDFIKGAPH